MTPKELMESKNPDWVSAAIVHAPGMICVGVWFKNVPNGERRKEKRLQAEFLTALIKSLESQ